MVVRKTDVLRPQALTLHVGTNYITCGKDGTHHLPIGRHRARSQSCVGIHLRHTAWRPSYAVSLHRPFQFTRPHIIAIEFTRLRVRSRDEDIPARDDWRVIAMFRNGRLPEDVFLGRQIP